MNLLAVDTALDDCAVALIHGDPAAPTVTVVGEVIGRGHAERLIAMIEAATAEAGVALGEIDVFAASIGPGSFTGIRVGVAAVRGFAVATGRPSLGVSSLEALAHRARAEGERRPICAVLDARKDEVYAALFGPDGAALGEPMVTAAARAAEIAAEAGAVLVGPGAALLLPHAPTLTVVPPSTVRSVVAVAEIAAARHGAGEPVVAPAPLYVRAPDAKPQGHFRLARLVPGGLQEDRP